MEQYRFVEEPNDFIARWGLKKKFVAETCGISESSFSKFLSGKAALSTKQLERVLAYTKDYVCRNS